MMYISFRFEYFPYCSTCIYALQHRDSANFPFIFFIILTSVEYLKIFIEFCLEIIGIVNIFK